MADNDTVFIQNPIELESWFYEGKAPSVTDGYFPMTVEGGTVWLPNPPGGWVYLVAWCRQAAEILRKQVDQTKQVIVLGPIILAMRALETAAEQLEKAVQRAEEAGHA